MAERNTNTTENIKKTVSDEMIDQLTREFAKHLEGEEKVPLFLPEGAGIQNPLPVGINGVVYLLPVGVDLEVPKSVYNIVVNQSNVVRKNYGKTVRDGETVEAKVRRKANQ